jgi:hypothetical protein
MNDPRRKLTSPAVPAPADHPTTRLEAPPSPLELLEARTPTELIRPPEVRRRPRPELGEPPAWLAAELEAMEGHRAQLDRLSRAHADACRVGDRTLRRDLWRAMVRHAEALDELEARPGRDWPPDEGVAHD